MKELSDKKFDELLKQKADSIDLEFDESAWDKMEQKLRRRDRAVFIRNTSFILFFLMIGGFAYLQFGNVKESDDMAKDYSKEARKPGTSDFGKNGKSTEVTQLGNKQPGINKNTTRNGADDSYAVKAGNNRKIAEQAIRSRTTEIRRTTENKVHAVVKDPDFVSEDPAKLQALSNSKNLNDTIDKSGSSSLAANTPQIQINDESATISSPGDSSKAKRRDRRPANALSFTVLAGPDFSSISSVAGKKGTLNVGLLANLAVTKRISVSTGVRYGVKDYTAEAYDYQSSNPRAAYIDGIDASCNVLEIPLQASYAVLSKGGKTIRLSSGLSSYLMLKEKYDFRYTPASGYKTYSLTKSNENQHYLSVLSFSASYNFKPKSAKVLWAIEPYVRLPLAGVGDGKVHLKSSGVSLNLTYEIIKKRH